MTPTLNQLAGIFPALPTPVRTDDTVDTAAAEAPWSPGC